MKFLSYLFFTFLLAVNGLLAVQLSGQIEQIEDLLISIRLNRGDVLYPEDYYKSKQLFEELKSNTAGRQLTNDEEQTAHQLYLRFKRIDAASEALKPYFSSVFAARDEAIADGAEDFAPDIFNEAESGLQKAAERYRDQIPADAEGKINEILAEYRHAQFEALRNKLLSQVRILIQESNDLDAQKMAPRTYALVSDLLSEVESIINRNRFNDTSLQEKASQLSEESQHLLQLVQQAQKIRRNEAGFEEYMLQLENSISRLAALVNYEPRYSEGVSTVLENIGMSIESLQRENRMLRDENSQLSDSLQQMQLKIAQIQEKLGEQNDLKKRIGHLRENFAGTKIQVLEQDKELVLRLDGIQFQPGKIQVNASDQELLERMGEALRAFPDQRIRIRLANAASGSPEYSRALAEQRAKSVALIIETAGFIPEERITTDGTILDSRSESGLAVVDVIMNVIK